MDLSTAQDYFASDMVCERGGFHFKGQLGPQPGSIGENHFLLPRRVLKVGPRVDIHGGDLITSHGVRYIVQEHAQSEVFDAVIFKKYRLYAVTDVMTYQTDVLTNDSILGRSRETGTQTFGPHPLVVETVQLESDGGMLLNTTTVVRIISAVPIPVKAIVGGLFRITASDEQGGVYFLTAMRV